MAHNDDEVDFGGDAAMEVDQGGETSTSLGSSWQDVSGAPGLAALPHSTYRDEEGPLVGSGALADAPGPGVPAAVQASPCRSMATTVLDESPMSVQVGQDLGVTGGIPPYPLGNESASAPEVEPLSPTSPAAMEEVVESDAKKPVEEGRPTAPVVEDGGPQQEEGSGSRREGVKGKDAQGGEDATPTTERSSPHSKGSVDLLSLAWTTELYDLPGLAKHYNQYEILSSETSGKTVVLSPEGKMITGADAVVWAYALRSFKQSQDLRCMMDECPLPKEKMRTFAVGLRDPTQGSKEAGAATPPKWEDSTEAFIKECGGNSTIFRVPVEDRRKVQQLLEERPETKEVKVGELFDVVGNFLVEHQGELAPGVGTPTLSAVNSAHRDDTPAGRGTEGGKVEKEGQAKVSEATSSKEPPRLRPPLPSSTSQQRKVGQRQEPWILKRSKHRSHGTIQPYTTTFLRNRPL